MARILVTDPLDEAALSRLRAAGHDVIQGSKADAHDAEVWLVRSGTRITAADIEGAPGLRCIGRSGVGVDNIDLAAATRRGIPVFHAPTGNITSACEQAWALILACARRLGEADRSMKAGRWDRARLQGIELDGKTLFLVGFGRIGRMMAQRGVAFGMQVTAHDPYVRPEAIAEAGATWVGLEDGLRGADVVSLHTPLTPATRGLIDERRLRLMKPDAILVNAARGPLIDAEALLAVLADGHLFAAGLDVWPDEPPQGKAGELAAHPRVVAAPHLGASTREAEVKAALQMVERVERFLAGGPADLAVNATVAVDAVSTPWAQVVERLAMFLAQLVPARLQAVEVEVPHGLDAEGLKLHAALGVLRVSTDDANVINAPALAAERGWRVETRPTTGPGYVGIRLVAGDVVRSGEAIHSEHYGDRITRLMGFDVEFPAQGRFLVTRHKDVPGVLALIAAAIAKEGLNVGNVSLSRHDGEALAVIEVDGAIPPSARERLRALVDVHEAHRVRIGEVRA